MQLDAIKKIYFIGIGGIGMSALARYFHKKGAEVHGYDKTETDLTRSLAAEGMTIHYEDDVWEAALRLRRRAVEGLSQAGIRKFDSELKIKL